MANIINNQGESDILPYVNLQNLEEHKYYQNRMYSVPVCMFAFGGMFGTLLVKRTSKFFGRFVVFQACLFFC